MQHNIKVYTALTYIYEACKISLADEHRELSLSINKPLDGSSDSIYFLSVCEHKDNFSSRYMKAIVNSIINEIDDLCEVHGTYFNIIYDKNIERSISMDSGSIDSTRIGIIVNIGNTVELYT